MKLTVAPVQVQYAAQSWPKVEAHLVAAAQYCSDDYTIDQIHLMVCTGQWMLLVAVDEQNEVHGAATVNFINYPNDRVAFVTLIGGKLVSNADTFEQLKAILKQVGATKIQGAARESIARLWHKFGFEERYIVVETKL